MQNQENSTTGLLSNENNCTHDNKYKRYENKYLTNEVSLFYYGALAVTQCGSVLKRRTMAMFSWW